MARVLLFLGCFCFSRVLVDLCSYLALKSSTKLGSVIKRGRCFQIYANMLYVPGTEV